MGDVTFAVEARETTGKGTNRRLRQRGLVPGVVYGGGRPATPIAFDVARFERLLATSHSGVNTILDLTGPAAVTGKTVIAKELQREAVRGRITHVDFYEVDLKTKIDVEVPIHLVGTPVGVVNGAVIADSVVIGAAALGDVDGRQQRAVALAEGGDDLAQAVGDHRPAEVGDRVAGQLERLEGQPFGQAGALHRRRLGV